MKALDPAIIKMSQRVREILGAHMVKFPDDKHSEAIIDCLIVLCLEVGRLRWLCVATGEVSVEDFDRIFKEGMLKHYEEAKAQYGYRN